jgi:hypothetical protein
MSNIYLTFIRPLLEYACEDWDGCCEREIERLEKTCSSLNLITLSIYAVFEIINALVFWGLKSSSN